MSRRPRDGGEGARLSGRPHSLNGRRFLPEKARSAQTERRGAAERKQEAPLQLQTIRARPRRRAERGAGLAGASGRNPQPPHHPPILILIVRPVFLPRRQKRDPHVTALRKAESAFLLSHSLKSCCSPPLLPLSCPKDSALGNGPRLGNRTPLWEPDPGADFSGFSLCLKIMLFL